MIKKSIKLLFLILVVAILQIIFASSVNADALVASCQSTPANSLQNPIAINQSVNFISNVIGGTGNYIYSWFGACIGTQANCQNLYTSEGNYAAYLTVSDGSESQITACTAYVRQSCTSHDYKSCVGNAVYWFNSCNIQEEQFQACTGNQTCANGSCVDIACSSNSNCGNNGLIDSPFCQSGNVYQNYKTYTCHNPGTASSSCTNLITP
ncbi:MAG: hypothetical protein NT094_04870, partial [Candidatus Staskawiczbacteria bacterium]|nr:hypothetical protein [Candidatus Staskawiczbacteria bacterium]